MIVIRLATEADSVDLFSWRNDERTRAASISQVPVAWEEHSAWLRRSLENSNRVLYVATLFQVDEGLQADAVGEPIGMCRFDLDVGPAFGSGTAEVSINLDPHHRGKGLAGPVLKAAIARFQHDHGSTVRLTATVRADNAASSHLFTNQGFALVSTEGGFLYYLSE